MESKHGNAKPYIQIEIMEYKFKTKTQKVLMSKRKEKGKENCQTPKQ